MEHFRNPYNCPACHNPRLLINKIKKEDEYAVWLCVCSDCGFKKTLTLPAVCELVDACNKLYDIVRDGMNEKTKNSTTGNNKGPEGIPEKPSALTVGGVQT